MPPMPLVKERCVHCVCQVSALPIFLVLWVFINRSENLHSFQSDLPFLCYIWQGL